MSGGGSSELLLKWAIDALPLDLLSIKDPFQISTFLPAPLTEHAAPTGTLTKSLAVLRVLLAAWLAIL